MYKHRKGRENAEYYFFNKQKTWGVINITLLKKIKRTRKQHIVDHDEWNISVENLNSLHSGKRCEQNEIRMINGN